MPHCTLECSDNIVDQVDFQQVLLDIHAYLESTGMFQTADIKSRVVRHAEYVVGDGAADRAFVTVELAILGGRDKSVKRELSQSILSLLERHFPKTLADRRCSLTVRISDIDRDSYARSISYED
jgi:5-carboxymethyl-2-hydroxymuconate isomerase